MPDEGPLTEYESWMPDFMKGLAKGIEGSRGLIEKAARGVSEDMVIHPRVASSIADVENSAGAAGDENGVCAVSENGRCRPSASRFL